MQNWILIQKSRKKLIDEILEECTENSLRFAFYRKFPARFTKPYQMDDKQFIQVQYPAGARVTIHYRLIRDKVPVKTLKVNREKYVPGHFCKGIPAVL